MGHKVRGSGMRSETVKSHESESDLKDTIWQFEVYAVCDSFYFPLFFFSFTKNLPHRLTCSEYMHLIIMHHPRYRSQSSRFQHVSTPLPTGQVFKGRGVDEIDGSWLNLHSRSSPETPICHTRHLFWQPSSPHYGEQCRLLAGEYLTPSATILTLPLSYHDYDNA